MLRGLFAAALVPFAVLFAQNLFMNVALKPLLNRRPERFQVDFTVAWMWIPGQVQVRGLKIRNQGMADQWLVSADRASGTVQLVELMDRHFHASALRAAGVSVRYRRRRDLEASATPVGVADSAMPVRAERSEEAPIEGLSNPPSPNPDLLYPGPIARWTVRLDDLVADGVREIWVGDYRLTGDARVRADANVSADLSLADPFLDVSATIFIDGMRADIGDAPVAQAIHGEVSVLVDSLDRTAAPADRFDAVSAQVRLGADVQDLCFLDGYLQSVPWLTLTGTGHTDVDAGIVDGEFLSGSHFSAWFPELLVRIAGDDVMGAGAVKAEVGTGSDGAPQSRLAVDFDEFAIVPDGSSGALVEGTGFHVGAVSPDTSLSRPYTSVDVVVDLPLSQIPDFALYNAFMPLDVGLSLRQGTGTVRGHLAASSADNHAEGDVFLTGDEVVVQSAALVVSGDIALHARLADADLAAGRYDLSGTTVSLTHAGLLDQAHREVHDRSRSWSASLSIPSGVIRVGAPVYLDASLRLQCRDSVPLVTVFASNKDVPDWVRSLLTVQNISGEARVQLGRERLSVSPCTVRSGEGYQVDLRFFRSGAASHGDLLVRRGVASVGIALRTDGTELQLFFAKRWFYAKEYKLGKG